MAGGVSIQKFPKFYYVKLKKKRGKIKIGAATNLTILTIALEKIFQCFFLIVYTILTIA